MTETNVITMDANKPYIKLIKNTKGFQWEIKVEGEDLDKLKKINERLEKEYGGSNE